MIIDDYVPKLYELFSFSEDRIHKVALKIVNGNVLTISDRKMIYTLLSGDDDPDPLFSKKRGPSNLKNIERDIKLAELHEKLKNLKIKPSDIMAELINFIKSNYHVTISEGAIYKAIRNGHSQRIIKQEEMIKRKARTELFKSLKKT